MQALLLVAEHDGASDVRLDWRDASAYRRSDMRDKRRRMMQDWASYANRPASSASKNVSIRPADRV
jgi:hypothetical protein